MAVLVTNRVANKRVCFLTVDHGAGGQLAREVDKIVARVAEVGVLRGVVPPFFRVRRWCGRRALYFRLLAGVVAQPCAFRWLALEPRTMLRLLRKKKYE